MRLGRLPWLVALREAEQLFVAWPVAPGALAARIPGELTLDLFEDRAWLALAVFRIERLRARGLPPVPGLSRFAEANYLLPVRRGDDRGVWFLRIDAATRAGARVGRWLALPYHHSAVTIESRADWRCARVEATPAPQGVRPELRVRYRPQGPEETAAPGTLAHFVVERFVMFGATTRGTLLRGLQARAPRRLRPCEVVMEHDTLSAAAGVPGPGGAPAAWYCRRTDVRTWLPVPAGPAPPSRTGGSAAARGASLDVQVEDLA